MQTMLSILPLLHEKMNEPRRTYWLASNWVQKIITFVRFYWEKLAFMCFKRANLFNLPQNFGSGPKLGLLMVHPKICVRMEIYSSNRIFFIHQTEELFTYVVFIDFFLFEAFDDCRLLKEDFNIL